MPTLVFHIDDATLQKAAEVDERYFGEIDLKRSIEVLTRQIESLRANPSRMNVQLQAGDLLFALVSLSRNQGFDLNEALRTATDKIELRRQQRHYYEAHVTIEPVFEERLERFKTLCADYKFHVASLLMQKRKTDTPERSANDSFCTGRSTSYSDLEGRMLALVQLLRAQSFEVWRYKIESTMLDSRYDDSKLPLPKENLPEKEREPRAPADGALAGRR